MGYYTRHRIKIVNEYNSKENLELLKEYIEKISGYSFYIVDLVIVDYSIHDNGGIKWYNCEENMCSVSKFFPEFKIEVKGKGEDGNLWASLYQNGEEFDVDTDYFTGSESDDEYDYD